jgi:orotidine-5'-phosphate decarboxylase
MSTHAADRLLDAIDRIAAPVCVGLDPVIGRLPESMRPPDDSPTSTAGLIRSFTLGVLDAVAGRVPCVKFQSACYERYGQAGVQALLRAIGEAKSRGLEVILDAKRGDIGISASHYAAAAFGDDPDDEQRPDWLTINSYLGEDGIRPFLQSGRGAFALVRTSNPGGDALQGQRLEDGRTVAESVADLVATIGTDHVGTRGYSALGAVVGATKTEDAAALRRRMGQQIFLVPGYGAQGGGVEDVLPCFDADGRGAIVTASRSVIYAFDPGDANWTVAVAEAANRLADDIGRAVGMR